MFYVFYGLKTRSLETTGPILKHQAKVWGMVDCSIEDDDCHVGFDNFDGCSKSL